MIIKKGNLKVAISFILVGICVLLYGMSALASEEIVAVNQEEIYKCVSLPQEFDENVSFQEIEAGIVEFIEIRELDIEIGSEDYIDLMYSFLYGEVDNIDELTSRYFGDYASVYVVKAQEIAADMDAETKSLPLDNYNIHIGGTIQEIKLQNMEKQVQLENESQSLPPTPRAAIDVARAQEYAAVYALSWNYVFGRFPSDCTNFASQIVNYAGMPLVPGAWQWNGNDLAKRRWNVAHDFVEYWSIIRGYNGGEYNSRASVNSNANPGDIIAYMRSDTYVIWHVAFVQSKSGGNIYISQHTTDRYNNKWNDISINYPSTYMIVKFS